MRRLVIMAASLAGVWLIGCGGPRPDSPLITSSPEDLGSLLTEPPAAGITARLFLTIEGGFLEEERLKINGQLALEWPDRLRLIGQYGALKKVFDLGVQGGRFTIYDHRKRSLYRGDALDAAAVDSLGFAIRPGDLLRLLRLGGRQVFEDGVLGDRTAGGDSLRVSFEVPGDPAIWHAGVDLARGRIRSLQREVDGTVQLQVLYRDHFQRSGRTVPRRLAISRPGRDERVEIEIRSIRFTDELADRLFHFEPPAGAEIVELSGS